MKKIIPAFWGKFVQFKWAPLMLALTAVFVPNSLVLVKLLLGVLALVIFYFSFISDMNISSRDI